MTPDGGAKPTREDQGKARKTHAERALANLRAVKRAQREITEPGERSRILLTEANVLALLELADALRALAAATRGLEQGGTPRGA